MKYIGILFFIAMHSLPSLAEISQRISEELMNKTKEFLLASIDFEQYVLMLRNIRRNNDLQNNKQKYPIWEHWNDIPAKYKVELMRRLDKRNKWAQKIDQILIIYPNDDMKRYEWLFAACPLSTRSKKLDNEREAYYKQALEQKMLDSYKK